MDGGLLRTRVCYLITELNVGGAEKVVLRLATLLPEDRYDVLVACLYDPGPVADEIRAAGVPVVDLSMRNKVDLRAVFRLYELLRSRNIQILHAHMFHANLLAAVVGRIANVPVVIATRHTVEMGGAAREWVNCVTVALCDAMVVVSNQVHELQLRQPWIDPTKLVVIPNGVPVETATCCSPESTQALRQEWGIDADVLVVGTVARLGPEKGHAYLLEAAAEVLKQVLQTRLLLVGDGPMRSQLEGRAKALGVADSIVFAGLRHDVPTILSLFDLFVLPSLWEGLPMAVLEAMAAGLPVVATAVGGTPEVVVDGVTGLLVPPGDPDALAEAIFRLLRDPDLRQRMGQAGRERVVERFSAERMVERTEQLYEQLLAEKGLAQR
ncbi:MAG: glycosyltransferase [Anaerolineae bacterium]|nr:glycosyltransferase [Anaerolineae bacterium]